MGDAPRRFCALSRSLDVPPARGGPVAQRLEAGYFLPISAMI